MLFDVRFDQPQATGPFPRPAVRFALFPFGIGLRRLVRRRVELTKICLGGDATQRFIGQRIEIAAVGGAGAQIDQLIDALAEFPEGLIDILHARVDPARQFDDRLGIDAPVDRLGGVRVLCGTAK